MKLFNSKNPLRWGELDLPLLGIASDWFGKPLDLPMGFSLAADEENLWFVATRQAEGCVHPDSSPGSFTPELWKYDTAELFIADERTGRYLEFNLAPNGAWWAAQFSSPRVQSKLQPEFTAQVVSYRADEPGQWLTALSIPLAFLEETVDFGARTKANATFILGSPDQTFHSAAMLPGEEPDFHQPSAFPVLTTYPIA